MEELTKGEEKIMQIVWKLKKCFVKDILEEMSEPKPPYNTISSVIRVLRDKGFVKFKQYGNTYEYTPAVSKPAYKKYVFGQLLKNFFDGSYESMVSYMVEDEKISEDEMKEIKAVVNKKADE